MGWIYRLRLKKRGVVPYLVTPLLHWFFLILIRCLPRCRGALMTGLTGKPSCPSGNLAFSRGNSWSSHGSVSIFRRLVRLKPFDWENQMTKLNWRVALCAVVFCGCENLNIPIDLESDTATLDVDEAIATAEADLCADETSNTA